MHCKIEMKIKTKLGSMLHNSRTKKYRSHIYVAVTKDTEKHLHISFIFQYGSVLLRAERGTVPTERQAWASTRQSYDRVKISKAFNICLLRSESTL